jgi:hypothetical protein
MSRVIVLGRTSCILFFDSTWATKNKKIKAHRQQGDFISLVDTIRTTEKETNWWWGGTDSKVIS